MSERLAIITARGGSKRIPRKNIRNFCGKPIISYSIEAALESKLFDEVMVSTDDDEIKDVALKYGAVVPFMRSELNANDAATTVDVLLEVLDQYHNLQRDFEEFCCIYPTAPFVTAEKLEKSNKILEGENISTVISVVGFSFPIQRGIIQKGGYGEMLYPQYMSTRSQDLEQVYHDAGQFYWAKVDDFISTPMLIDNNTALYVIDEMEVQDIDNESDWQIAELKYKLLHGRIV